MIALAGAVGEVACQPRRAATKHFASSRRSSRRPRRRGRSRSRAIRKTLGSAPYRRAEIGLGGDEDLLREVVGGEEGAML